MILSKEDCSELKAMMSSNLKTVTIEQHSDRIGHPRR